MKSLWFSCSMLPSIVHVPYGRAYGFGVLPSNQYISRHLLYHYNDITQSLFGNAHGPSFMLFARIYSVGQDSVALQSWIWIQWNRIQWKWIRLLHCNTNAAVDGNSHLERTWVTLNDNDMLIANTERKSEVVLREWLKETLSTFFPIRISCHRRFHVLWSMVKSIISENSLKVRSYLYLIHKAIIP